MVESKYIRKMGKVYEYGILEREMIAGDVGSNNRDRRAMAAKERYRKKGSAKTYEAALAAWMPT